MKPYVSIILPTYNGGSRIEKAIQSVRAQSFTDWELLMIDDGSTDGTDEIVQKFVIKDSRIRYLRNEKNLGIQKTLNRGLREAQGEYIARIDDDDIWIDNEKLKKQFDFLEENKGFVLVGTGMIAVNEKDEEVYTHLSPILDKDIRNKILSKNCFTHSGVFFRKESALSVGGYDDTTETMHIEDYDLWLKLGTVGLFANIPICGVKVTLRRNSISSKNKILQFKKSINTIKKYKNKYPKYYQAHMSLYLRMCTYIFLQIGFLSRMYNFLYKYYKKL